MMNNCPLCKIPLDQALLSNVGVDYCSRCYGLWFEEDELQEAKDQKDENLRWFDIDLWKDFFVNNPSLELLGLDSDEDIHFKSEKFIRRQLWRYESGLYGLLALIDKKTDKLVGQCGLLTQEVDGETELEIGYHLIPKYWRQGFAREAAQFFKDYAFENNLSEALISIINVKNFASQKVAEKNGMTNIRKTFFLDKEVYIFQINKSDWKK